MGRMRIGTVVALLAGGLVSGAAQAAPAWRWDGPRTYTLEARLQLPQLAWVEPLQGA